MSRLLRWCSRPGLGPLTTHSLLDHGVRHVLAMQTLSSTTSPEARWILEGWAIQLSIDDIGRDRWFDRQDLPGGAV